VRRSFRRIRRELLEVMLERRRRDDLEDPALGIAGVPEGVPLVARLEREVAGFGVDHVVAEQRPSRPSRT
jgi:hypothetical protein